MEKLHIPENLYKQFLCGKYCDLQIQVESSYFRAHSCVIAAASWVLEAILQSSTTEDPNLSKVSIQLHGVTAYAISALLGYIYTGRFPPEVYSNVEKRREVLHAAKLYKMDEVSIEFQTSPPTNTNGGMSNLQMLESGNLNDNLLDNFVPSDGQNNTANDPHVGPVDDTGTDPEPVQMNVILAADQFNNNDVGEVATEKLGTDAVKDHVAQTVNFAKTHSILYCVLCSEICSTEAALISHMTTHRSETRKSGRPERAAAAAATFVLDASNTNEDAFDDFGVEFDDDSPKRKRGAAKKAFTCSECGISYTAKVYLIKHYNQRHPGSLFCKFCAERFDTAELLQTHIITHGPDIEEDGGEGNTDGKRGKGRKGKKGRKSYTCNLCSTSFLKRKELVQHQQNLHGIIKPMHICTTCGKEFKEKASLRAHNRVHTGEKPYMCSYCGNSFADAKTWKDHERRHRGEKPFLCTTCGKSFTYRQSFTRHMKFHEGKRPFQCSFCGKAFVLRQNMKEHEKRHNK